MVNLLQPELDKQEFGFWFQSQWLALMRKAGVWSHPLVDTRTAGNIVNPQPSDITSVFKGLPVYQECKTSTDYTDFKTCYRSHIRKEQAAAGRMITYHGGIYLFPFLSRTDRKLYVYDGVPVIACYHRKSVDFPAPILMDDWSNRSALIEELKVYLSQLVR